MNKVTQIENLAHKICRFICSYDPYEDMDCNVSFDEFVKETVSGLWDVNRRKGIASDLKGIAEWSEIDEDAYEASMLYREVVAL